MKIAFCSDVHIGNHRRFAGAVLSGVNERARSALRVLNLAVERALDHGCEGFVVCGDLFHGASPSPQLVAEVMRSLPGRASEMPAHLLVGNHELVSDQLGDHALASLQLVPELWVHERPRVHCWGSERRGVHLIAVPFRRGPVADWLPGVLAEYAADVPPRCPKILALHAGVSDEQTPVFLRGSHDSIEAVVLADLCHEHGICCAFAGNWHRHRRWSFGWPDGKRLAAAVEVVQLGALAPDGFRDAGLEGYGTLAIWDDGKIVVEELPGPRFLQLAVGESAPEAPAGCALFTEERGGEEVERAAAVEAAVAARSVDTLSAALAAYVERMPVEDGVDRQAVLAKAKEYLAR